jgi:hypothetical protein
VFVFRLCRGTGWLAGWYCSGFWCEEMMLDSLLGRGLSWGDSVTAEMGWKEDMALWGFRKEWFRDREFVERSASVSSSWKNLGLVGPICVLHWNERGDCGIWL